MSRVLRVLSHVVFSLILIAGVAWTATAVWFHLSGGVQLSAYVGLGAGVLIVPALYWRSKVLSWGALIVAGLLVGGWYQTITPQQDRDWAADVSRGVTARIEGDQVTLGDIRDFEWTSPTEAKQNWVTRNYDLSKLETVDMITSVWSSSDIAHLLVSFGFSDGEHVVFSAEIRREVHETFNEIGGFFRQFELVLIGATERDIVKLRTNYRGENVSVFPVELTPAQRRTMFLSFVDLAQKLESKSAFYNTVKANCTTVVYQLAKTLQPNLPMDWRLVLSGHLPEYLFNLGVLGGEGSLDARRASAHISDRARQNVPGVAFSQLIRSE
ncbi:DUF4105 domain-containing protein [Roseibium algae]|uniref:DUF4105 domain-containing protein n=1 Tax=Roseibium algae TaxID=3123038 RepID=A0ABU8TMN1_9HYPH